MGISPITFTSKFKNIDKKEPIIKAINAGGTIFDIFLGVKNIITKVIVAKTIA